MQDPLKYFRVEARDIVEQLQGGLLELERSGAHPSRTQSLLRFAHTLKGAARVVKQLEIANLAHRFEDLLVPLRDAERTLEPAQIEALLGVVDAIGEKVAGLAPVRAPDEPATTPQAVEGQRFSERPPSPSAPEEPSRPIVAPLEQVDAVISGVAELGFQLGSLRRALPELSDSQRLAAQVAERLAPRRFAEMSASQAASLRVLTADLSQRLERLEREVGLGLSRATRELAQVRDQVDQLRLVAASSIFSALARTARDAAVSLGKQATLETHGGDVRLDAEVLGAVQRALVQAVRNAVAHGIEPVSERQQRGKPPTGRVTVEVRRRGRHIAFTCRDDGRGVNLREVRRQAERLGRLPAEATTEEDLLGLLLRGGISTSAQVSEVSGRGVGLDLIRESLAGVGGTVSLRNHPGAGADLTLSVPASLTALEALSVEAAGGVHCIPLDAVVRALRVEDSEIARGAEGASLLFGAEVIPFAPVARLLKSQNSQPERKVWSVVVITHGQDRLALGVDRLLGSDGLVAHALPDSADVEATVAGVSLDADGNPRLLLDPEGLIAAARTLRASNPSEAPKRHAILVIDDSLTTRMLEQSILESAGYEVELATSAEEGLEKAALRRYDLFLVDVEMPGMDGFAFVERTRADQRLSTTPAVLVTSRVSPEDLARGRAAGAAGHIAKGEFDQVDFLERIRGLMQ
ncbi:MAG: hybrid sensor histidine kinase/response regulator [Myxococcales bacterium]|nr:MAG: hybrid sensor histidine kinase/response regulator [Myxococcales bacterium]